MVVDYDQYLKMVKEGLIFSFNIEKYISTLKLNLKFIGLEIEYDIEDKFQYKLRIINNFFQDDDSYELFMSYNNNLGYYPTYMWITNTNDMKNDFKFDYSKLNSKYKEITVQFESKYDDGLYKNDLSVPNKAYHLSYQKYKKKILYNGLIPKYNKRKIYHPERVYMFYELSDFVVLLKELKRNDKKKYFDENKTFNDFQEEDYILYEINLKYDIIIHTDPNFIDGFFTYENIHPNQLKILKEKL